jgi:hypothetical protein
MARPVSGPVGIQGILFIGEKMKKDEKIVISIVVVLQIGIRAWLQHLAYLGS